MSKPVTSSKFLPSRNLINYLDRLETMRALRLLEEMKEGESDEETPT